jgi:transposase
LSEQKRKRYTTQFKKEAVELVLHQDYTLSQAASSLGIGRGILGRWRKEYREQGLNSFPGAGHQSPEVEELKRLREENRKLKLEKEILKKAAAFFARESG